MTENNQLIESLKDQRRLLTNVLLVTILVLNAIWFLVYLVSAPDSFNLFGLKQLPIEPWIAYYILGGIALYSVVALALNQRKRLPFPQANSVIMIFLLAAFVFLSDELSEVVSGRTSFILLAPVFLAAELIHPVAGLIAAMLEFGVIALISRNAPNLEMNNFSIAVIYFLAIIAMINAQKKINATAAAFMEGKKNLAVFRSMADGVLVYDATGKCIQSNEAANRILEGEERFQELFQAAAKSEIIQWTKTKTLAVKISPLQDEKLMTIGTVATIRDYSREYIINRMQKTILSVVSHELRTPIAAIKGYADLLGMVDDDPAARQEAREEISNNAQRLLLLASDLLDKASIEAGRLSVKVVDVDIHILIANAVDLQKNAATVKGLSLTTTIAPGVHTIRSDPNRLSQVLNNLIGNAVKFTDKGVINVNAIVINKHIEISVKDTGMGIAAENIEFIFDAFRRLPDVEVRNSQGAGLGLSISKGIVELLGGEITVTSTPQIGSTFIVKLPLNKDEL